MSFNFETSATWTGCGTLPAMHTFITQIAAALEQRNRPLRFFLRDDDVSDNEASLQRLLELCLRCGMPINLAVIPGKLTQEGAALLNAYIKQHPTLIELNQHGWLHLNYETTGKKCEFGASRDAAKQHADLAAGQARMNADFGPNWFPVFVPPWNRCTETTAQLLTKLGFRALSRDVGHPPLPAGLLPELPVTIDLQSWRGEARLRPLDEFTRELIAQIESNDCIGLMLHHQVMDDAAFAWLEALLQTLARAPQIERHTFQSLLSDEQSSHQAS